MRTTACLVLLLLSPGLAAAQSPTPLISLAPPPVPIFGPRTVVPAHVACSDVPVAKHEPGPLRILTPYGVEARELAFRDTIVVLSGGTPQGVTPGQRFYSRRLTPLRPGEPRSERSVGAIHTSGWLTVIAADEHSALARVDYACDAVMSGDYLEPFVEPGLPDAVSTAAGRADFANLGRVLQGTDRNEMFGAGDYTTIDRGTAAGLTAGTRIVFFRDRGDGTPLVELGSGIVLDVNERTAKVVLDSARAAVRTDDYWGVRQP
jgi:hypothetical protein